MNQGTERREQEECVRPRNVSENKIKSKRESKKSVLGEEAKENKGTERRLQGRREETRSVQDEDM